jgi:hypothetical protein
MIFDLLAVQNKFVRFASCGWVFWIDSFHRPSPCSFSDGFAAAATHVGVDPAGTVVGGGRRDLRLRFPAR